MSESLFDNGNGSGASAPPASGTDGAGRRLGELADGEEFSSVFVVRER